MLYNTYVNCNYMYAQGAQDMFPMCLLAQVCEN